MTTMMIEATTAATMPASGGPPTDLSRDPAGDPSGFRSELDDAVAAHVAGADAAPVDAAAGSSRPAPNSEAPIDPPADQIASPPGAQVAAGRPRGPRTGTDPDHRDGTAADGTVALTDPAALALAVAGVPAPVAAAPLPSPLSMTGSLSPSAISSDSEPANGVVAVPAPGSSPRQPTLDFPAAQSSASLPPASARPDGMAPGSVSADSAALDAANPAGLIPDPALPSAAPSAVLSAVLSAGPTACAPPITVNRSVPPNRSVPELASAASSPVGPPGPATPPASPSGQHHPSDGDAGSGPSTAFAAAAVAPAPVATVGPAAEISAPAAPITADSAGVHEQLAAVLVPLREHDSGSHQLTVQLHPAELGPVTLIAHLDRGSITVELTSASQSAHDAMAGSLPDLHRALNDSGFATVTVSMGVGSGLGDTASDAGFGGAAANPDPGQRGSHYTSAPPGPSPTGSDPTASPTRGRDTALDRWL